MQVDVKNAWANPEGGVSGGLDPLRFGELHFRNAEGQLIVVGITPLLSVCL